MMFVVNSLILPLDVCFLFDVLLLLVVDSFSHNTPTLLSFLQPNHDVLKFFVCSDMEVWCDKLSYPFYTQAFGLQRVW